MPKTVAEAIDHLCATEMRFAGELPRNVIWPLYEAARSSQGGDPLVYQAATRLQDTVQEGDVVFVVTGSGSKYGLTKGETDGPLGAASLARALDLGLKARVVVICEAAHAEPVKATVEAAGLSVLDEEFLWKRPHTAVLEILPAGADAGRAFAERILKHFDPKALVFVEKTGPNDEGVHHSIMGSAKPSDEVGHAHFLADLAAAQDRLTIGIGDGGNEIGFGKIQSDVQRVQPYGTTCQCPCKGGVATRTATEVLVAASISNWGAYGVTAQLAFQLKRPELIQSEEMEAFMLRQCVAAGGTDGAYASQILYVDGTSSRIQTALVAMLHEIVENGLKWINRGF